MTITLFPDQEYLVNEALRLTDNGKKHENVLVTSPSGSGKTIYHHRSYLRTTKARLPSN